MCIRDSIEYEYAQNMLFPRMYSSSHAPLYKQWVDIKGYDVPYDQCGEMRSEEHTSELQSLRRISYAVFCLKKKR